MTHSDDDGLVLPPRLAPKHIAILPIHRSDEEKSRILQYCEALKRELALQSYNGRPLGVILDDRDIRGGEKKWHHIKRGVPIRIEVGQREIDNDSLFVGRRDRGKSETIGRAQFVAGVSESLDQLQSALYGRALKLRDENLCRLKTLSDFKGFFTPVNSDKPEIHGGFAQCHFVDCDEVHQMLKPLMVSPRCIPLEEEKTPGTCVFTGQKTQTQAIFAKAY
jgi:prolyl-tRNA synthetase